MYSAACAVVDSNTASKNVAAGFMRRSYRKWIGVLSVLDTKKCVNLDRYFLSAIGPKRTCRKTQSMPLSGVKRTSIGAPQMSAFDPKRTLGWTSVQLDFAVSASNNLFTTKREGAEHAFAHSGRRSLREETCRLARGETPSRRNCTDRRFKDGKAAFPQEWRRGGRQGWRKDRQRIGTRLGIRRTGRPPRSAPYGRREDPGAI